METTPKTIGRYVIIEVLESGTELGSPGPVYKAKDLVVGSVVVIKTFVLDKELSPSLEALERFREIVRAVSTLEHPQIVAVFEGSVLTQIPYIVMDYVSGESLSTLLKREQILTQEVAIRYLTQLAAAIDYAHDKGIIHRGLCPSCILIDHAGEICVKDFAATYMSEILHGGILSTQGEGFAYSAPELLSSEVGKDDVVTKQADIYSLATIVYEMLTGVHPFRRDDGTVDEGEILDQDAEAPSLYNEALSSHVDIVFSHALAKEADARYETAHAFLDALQKALAEVPHPTTSTPTPELTNAPTPREISEALAHRTDASHRVVPQETRVRRKFFSRMNLLLLLVLALLLAYGYKAFDGYASLVEAIKPSEGTMEQITSTKLGKSVRDTVADLWKSFEQWQNPPAAYTDGRAVEDASIAELFSIMISARDNEERILSALNEATRRGASLLGMAPYLLNSPFTSVRLEGIKILEKRDDSVTIGQLEKKLSDPEPAVRLAVIKILKAKGGAGILTTLTKAQNDERDPEVKAALTRAITAVQDKVMGAKLGSLPVQGDE